MSDELFPDKDGMPADYRPGVKPDIHAPNPKEHPFSPVRPGSTSCKWCAFAITAHKEVEKGAELADKHSAQVAESG